jgi:hypothetical protein
MPARVTILSLVGLFFGSSGISGGFFIGQKRGHDHDSPKKCRKTGLRQIRPQGGASWGSPLAALLVLVRRLELRITAEFIGY